MNLLRIIISAFIATNAAAVQAKDDPRTPYIDAFNQVESVYAKDLKDLNKVLRWKEEKFKLNGYQAPNMTSDWFEDENHLTISINFAGYKGIDLDAFTLSICHEMGHFFGSLPIKNKSILILDRELPTSTLFEGQADYYATLKCLRRVWKDSDNLQIIQTRENFKVPYELCKSVFPDTSSAALCTRSILAAQKDAEFIVAWEKRARKNETIVIPKLEHKDTHVVSRTTSLAVHPNSQCRLDTYVAGALCSVDAEVNLSPLDPIEGSCSTGVGARPACWFKL